MPEPFTLHPSDVPLLDVFAHDLRSPLLGVRGFLSEIQRSAEATPGTEEIREDLVEVQEGIEHIETLINGLLTLCRRSRRPLQPEALDMNAVVRQAIAQVEAHRGPQPITLAPLPPCQGDRAPLTEVFVHLLDNAAQPGGPSQIEGERGDRIHYRIIDSGPGFSPEMRRRAFELFCGAGDGIGLSLARHLLIMHSGWLRLTNTDTGCKAEVSLPV